MSAAKTKAQQAKKDTKPRQEFNNISQLGLKAQALAVEHQSKLGDRLGPSFLIDFSKDLNELNVVVPAVLTITDGKVQLTAAQLAALEEGSLVSALGRSSGRHLHQLARAIDDRAVVPDRVAKSIGHEETYPQDLFDADELRGRVVRLSDAVGGRLRAAGTAA